MFDKLTKNKEYRYAGHSIKKAPSPTQPLNDIQTEGANDIIANTESNLKSKPNLVDKFFKSRRDKIIHGESKFGKFYTDWVDRLTPIENLVKKAEEKAAIPYAENPYLQARMYAGFVESYKQQIENETFVKTADGKIEV